MDAHEPSTLLADDRQIDEVMDLETGAVSPAATWVPPDYQRVLEFRMELMQAMRAGRPRLACPMCAVPVHLVSMTAERRFYFRHETEDGRCPAKTKGRLSGEHILALKYDGARESAAHRGMKELIAESLKCDPDFSDIQIEPVWKGREENAHRRPDVRAVWRGRLPVAFEVQLSTTFLRVIAERREFYLREGGLLLWVFKEFAMGDARLTQDDIFYNNNRNAFLASRETLAASRERGKLALDCVWSEPSVESGHLGWRQRRCLATFDELAIDQRRQRVFLFDADGAREKLEREVTEGQLRADFRRYWLREPNVFDELAWSSLRERFAALRIELPIHPGAADGFYQLLDTLYTVREGRSVGWRHDNLVKLAHHVFEAHKGHLWMFKLILAAHDRGERIKSEDASRKWRQKVTVYREAWASGDEHFDHDDRFDPLVAFLFPEIAKDLGTTPH
jgi:hypothetical protein